MHRLSTIFGRGIPALIVFLISATAQAAPTWQVQADFSGTTTRSLRGIALSPDDSQEYLGYIQGTSSTTAVREYSSAILAGTNPAITASVTFNGLQPKGVAVDDRGYVYGTYSNSAGAAQQHYRIYSSDLLTLEKDVTMTTGAANYQLGGIAVQTLGGVHYAYVSTNKGTASIERWNVETPTAPFLDTTWAASGVLNLKLTQGSNAFVNGLDIAPDGTIYATGGVLGTGRGDKVFKISADGSSINSSSVDQALDVVLYFGKLYVAQYKANLSRIAVLDASSLSLLDTYDPGISRIATDDTGFSGIDVSADGRLYVSDQIYSTSGSTHDRVLVSSPVPEPALGMAAFLAVTALMARRTRRGSQISQA